MKYCDEYVCLYVCLSVCLSAHLFQNYTSEVHKIPSTCELWQWLGPPLTTMQYPGMLCTFGFVDDVMFADNQPGRDDASKVYVQSDSPGGSTGAEV